MKPRYFLNGKQARLAAYRLFPQFHPDDVLVMPVWLPGRHVYTLRIVR